MPVVAPEPEDLSGLADDAVARVAEWLRRAALIAEPQERRSTARLAGVVTDPAGVVFAMRFVDRVIRPEDRHAAADELAALVRGRPLPSFLGPIDRVLLRAGARLAPTVPGVVMPLARRRMRGLVGHLVVDARPTELARHLARRRTEGFRTNVNLLGEAVLGDQEAARRHRRALQLLDQPDVDYVSVKVSAIVAQLTPWDLDDSVERVTRRLRPLLVRAAATDPPTFVNLDMEEYHDLELTMTAFMRLLDEPELHATDAGIVLQAYLPDSFGALRTLVDWASARRSRRVDGRRGGEIKIRLVKGANLAMERVDAAMHGWEQAPYDGKADVDANFKRCLDWLMTPERTAAVRVGVGSHNLFDVAFARLLAERRGVADRVGLEMLEGMAATHARIARDEEGGMLLYTPAVAPAEFDVAISYLFRRLEENAAPQNFIRHLFDLDPDGDDFVDQAQRFRAAVDRRWSVPEERRRTQDRTRPVAPAPVPAHPAFRNEPDTDPSSPANRAWARRLVARPEAAPTTALVRDRGTVDDELACLAAAAPAWAARPAAERRRILHAVADELARRRGDLVATMVSEGAKTVAQADPEVSEAIDFARYYADRALDLETSPTARFEPLGVVAVVPPWNFPVAIPAGGTLAALAAGNAVVLKPAPEVPRCAELVAECCHAGGVPDDVLRLLRVPDDDTGRHLVTHPRVDAVVLTGAYDTAALFRSWRPDLRILAETSGKNAIVVTAHADIDLAVADIVSSAFGHAGQKCSAASLAILVGDVAGSPRLRRQLVDAVTSLRVGPPDDLATTMGPVLHEPTGKLRRALCALDPGEEWLVEPRRLDDRTWTPGVRAGVRPGSWFHVTECFGPVLGLLAAADLDDAIRLQNATPFGLTGGIHTLDEDEVRRWVDAVRVGNAYVNRTITGAIVRRQPFGGWKRSSVGPGAKAGGPNYVAQLGRWVPVDRDLGDDEWLRRARASDEAAWTTHVAVDHDETGLDCESNVFRYRPLPGITVRVQQDARPVDVARVLDATRRCGVVPTVSDAATESDADFAASLGSSGDHAVERVRLLGTTPPVVREAAFAAGIHVADDPVTSDGRIELLHYVREQSVSRTLHRYGNLLARDPRRGDGHPPGPGEPTTTGAGGPTGASVPVPDQRSRTVS